jgi:hypothetical protein
MMPNRAASSISDASPAILALAMRLGDGGTQRGRGPGREAVKGAGEAWAEKEAPAAATRGPP